MSIFYISFIKIYDILTNLTFFKIIKKSNCLKQLLFYEIYYLRIPSLAIIER